MRWLRKIFVFVLFYFANEVTPQEYPSLAPFINEIIDDVDGDSAEVIPEIELSTVTLLNLPIFSKSTKKVVLILTQKVSFQYIVKILISYCSEELLNDANN